MSILLLRHADAGHRPAGVSDDHLRPVDGRGRLQSERLVERLLPFRVERVVTSPYVRCRQTVEPLAAALGLPIEERNELAEGAPLDHVRRFVDSLGDETAVLCTHGDIVQLLLGEESEKGSTWVLVRTESGELERREYLPPDP